MASQGHKRGWTVVACVAALAAVLWVVVGVRLVLAPHPASGGASADSTTAAGPGPQGSSSAASPPGYFAPRPLGRLAVRSAVVALGYTPDGKTLVVQLGDGTIQLRDPATGNVRLSVNPAREPGDSAEGTLAISPDGRYIATARSAADGSGSTVYLISPATGKVTATFPVNAPTVIGLAFSPDGNTLAIGAARNLILLNMRSRATISVSTDQNSFTGTSMYVSFSASGTYLAVASNDGLVKIFNMRTSKFAASIPASASVGDISGVTFSPDRSTLAVSGSSSEQDNGASSAEPSSWLWPVPAGKVTALQPSAAPGSAGDGTDALAFSPDGRMIVTGGESGMISFWNTRTGSPVTTDSAPSSIIPVTAAAFAPDGRSLVTAQSTDNGNESITILQLWSLYSGTGSPGQPSASGAWRTTPAGPALRPGTYRLNRKIVTAGSWIITLSSVQVASDGKTIFVIRTKNTSTSTGQISCADSPYPQAGSIVLANGQALNSEEAYCPGASDSASVTVPTGGYVTSFAVFGSSRGLSRSFAFEWDGPSELSGALSGLSIHG
jgi:WD40 repeat protein